MTEIWKDIVGYESLYQVSNFGKIRSLRKRSRRFGPNALMLKPSRNGDGYLQVKLSGKGLIETARVHRIVAMAFIPNPENLPEINHIDENKENNRVSNLEWCTRSYNNNYGSRKDKCRRSRILNLEKLQEDTVREFEKAKATR